MEVEVRDSVGGRDVCECLVNAEERGGVVVVETKASL